MRLRLPLSLVVLAALPAVARPSTVVPPANLGELARMSEATVLARAEASWTEAAAPEAMPWTATRFTRLRGVAGDAVPATFVVEEPGGFTGGRGVAVGGAPAYVAGRTYLLFLARRPAGHWQSRMLAYGLLVEDAGILRPLEQAADIDLAGRRDHEPVGAYRTADLLAHLAEVARGASWNRERAGLTTFAPLVPEPTGCGYFVNPNSNLHMRWFGYESGATVTQIHHTTPGQVGISDGGVSSIVQGAAAWQDHADSPIRYEYAGSIPRESPPNCQLGAQLGAVWFNDPCAQLPDVVNCTGLMAIGGVWYLGSTFEHDGELWHPVTDPWSVVNNGAECVGEVTFLELMTHELGHTLGFEHHAVTPLPSPTMSPTLKADGRGATLVGLDKTCAPYSYHTFVDVPLAAFAWRFVEAVENAGVTGGCAPGVFCPDGAVTRGQMAIFLLRAKEGPAYVPPPCAAAPFADVPPSSPFCPWIRELAARAVTAGCGGGNYCPAAAVSRDQMAVFLLRAREGAAYVPPACTAPLFGDVPCSNPFAAWINELVRRGITAGCGGGNYCPGQANTRAQMAVFLTVMFALPLPPI